MKKIFYTILAVAFLMMSSSANAQEANKNLLIGPGGNNWFFGIGGGVNAMYDGGNFSKPDNLALDINFGKWFTPAIGFRIGYVGIKNTSAVPKLWFTGDDPFNYNLAHVDAMWNIANTANYKASRVWNPVLYVRGGGILINQGKTTRPGLVGGLGLMNQFRVGERVSIAIDLSAVTGNEDNYLIKGKGRFSTFLTGTAGLIFDLGSRGFSRPATPKVDTRIVDELREQLRAANAKADEANKAVSIVNGKLMGLTDGKVYEYKQGNFLETVVKEVEKESIVPEILYFDLGKATLTGRELARLEYYAENTFKKDQKLLVTGCADLGTGTKEANDRLS
ncbi:MAG: hypothetical protein K5910_03840, partial [Bacteroidales bacterium]|nr:hypothetical protein [Bacteroidales bacterium]